MKKIITLVFVLISFNCLGQQVTFQKTFGGTSGDGANSVQQTSDEGYIIAGYTSSFNSGSGDVYLIKTDVFGDTMWTKTYGGSGMEFANAVQQTADSGYVIIGTTTGFFAGSYDIYLIRTNADGDLIWSKNFGTTGADFGFSVRETIDRGYIIAGYNDTFISSLDDFFLIKTDSIGNLVWSKSFGGSDVDDAYSVRQTTDKGYIMTGLTWSFGVGNVNTYLIKSDSSGNLLWSKTFGGINVDVGWDILQTADQGFIIAGNTTLGSGANDVSLIKTDSIGNLIWSKAYGEIDSDNGSSVQQTDDGGFIIAGTTNSFGADSNDIYLIKTDSIGNLLWSKIFGGIGFEYGSEVQQTADGGYILCGVTNNLGAGNDDVYLIKTDSVGNSGCNETNAATIVTTPVIQVTSPATIATTPPTIVTTPATIVDSGGTVTALCTTVGIQSEIQNPQSAISISPNPTTNNFTITFPNTINKGSIEIYDMMKKKIYKENIAKVSQKEIHFKNIVAGIYFVKVRDGEKEYCVKLVTK